MLRRQRRARWGYLLAVAGAFALVVAGALGGALPTTTFLTLIALPIAVYATVIVFRHYESRTLVRANSATVLLHLAVGVLLAVGLFLPVVVG